jgi:hypothetical protein
LNIHSGDAKKLYTDHKVKIQNLVELSWLSQIADPDLICGGKPNGRQLIGLQKLVAGYLEQNLVKSEVRTSDWESKLDEEQLQCMRQLFTPFCTNLLPQMLLMTHTVQ